MQNTQQDYDRGILFSLDENRGCIIIKSVWQEAERPAGDAGIRRTGY